MLLLIRELTKKKLSNWWDVQKSIFESQANFQHESVENQMKNRSTEGVEKLDKVIKDRILLGNSLKL